ncbi:hypothetical protein ABFU82_19760 [Nocardioides sp. WV_118_6]
MEETDGDGFEVVEYCGRLSCRKVIVQTAGRGRRREFCSETCRRGADREYKRAKAHVEAFERHLRNFRHEVAAYGRRADLVDGVSTPEHERALHSDARSALSAARSAIKYNADNDSPLLEELRGLVEAVEPLLEGKSARLTA